MAPAFEQNNFTDYFYNMGIARGNGGSVVIGASEAQLDYAKLTISFGAGMDETHGRW